MSYSAPRGLLALALALLACHGAPDPESSDATEAVGRGSWPVTTPGVELRLDAGGELGLWSTAGLVRTIDDEVLPGPRLTRARSLVVYARRPPAGGALRVADLSSGERRALSAGGAACLPLIAPDGRQVAFVDTDPDSGLAALFVVPIDGSEAPRQLTNRGVHRAPGRPPAGYLAPPDGPTSMSWTAAGLEIRAGERGYLLRVRSR